MNLRSGACGLPAWADVSPSSSKTVQSTRERERELGFKPTTLHPPKSWIPSLSSLSPFIAQGVERPLHEAIKSAAFNPNSLLDFAPIKSPYSSLTCVQQVPNKFLLPSIPRHTNVYIRLYNKPFLRALVHSPVHMRWVVSLVVAGILHDNVIQSFYI